MKRIVTLQDISCVGRCSITVALPVISAMGVECGILPTAVLSTHTMFQTFTCKDLSDQIGPVADAWQQEGINFDGIYTGYLSSEAQCGQICGFFDRFAGSGGSGREGGREGIKRGAGKESGESNSGSLVLVDPAMADNGKLYPAFGPDFPKAMAKVCARADVILPNITEACLLTGLPYRTDYDKEYIRKLLERLLELGCRKAVLTGVSFEKDRLGVVYLDREGASFSYFTRRCPVSYHGTGDLYSASAFGGLMRGLDLGGALTLAADFVVSCIEATAGSKSPRWYGVEFESRIPSLCQMLEERLKAAGLH